MDTVFVNSKNRKTSDFHGLLNSLWDKINLKRSSKHVVLQIISIYYTWKNIKRLFENNEFKISSPTCNEEFELPSGSNHVTNIQDYFEYILKKYGKKTDNPSMEIYVTNI